MATQVKRKVTTEDVPAEKAEVIIIRCPKCKKVHLVAIKHTLDRKETNEIGKLVAAGCASATVPLLEYRKMVPLEWCFTLCQNPPAKKVKSK